MTENIVKKEDVPVKKTFNAQEMRKDVLPYLQTGYEPNVVLKKLDQELSKSLIKEGIAATDKDSQKLLSDATMILGLDNHFPLMGCVEESCRTLAVEFANTLAKEFDCKTPSEKALSQVVVNSYIRVIDDSRRYNNCSNGGEYISKERTNHLMMLSKQMDRANRQFVSALTALKQIKSPPMQVSIKTNTAFIAQNQQLNNNSNPNETVKP